MGTDLTKPTGIGNAAVQEATGKGWDEWFSLLDAAGARDMDHASIARVLRDGHGVAAWWNQMVAVGYEQARGMRKKRQRPDGYSVSASRTIRAPVAAVYKAWKTPGARKKWLTGDELAVRTTRSEKSFRATWGAERTVVEVNFYSKGDNKTQVSVQHSRLKSAAAGARAKKRWAAALDRLRDGLEKE